MRELQKEREKKTNEEKANDRKKGERKKKKAGMIERERKRE